MNKLIAVILLVYFNYVNGEGVVGDQDQKSKENEAVVNNGQRWDGSNKNGGDWFDNKIQRYSGIWTETDKNGRGIYDADRYGQNEYYDLGDYDRYGGQVRYSTMDGWNGNRYGQGIRIGVNGFVGNQFDGNRQDRKGLGAQEDLRTQLLLNAGLPGGLGLNAGIQAGLGLNANLLARLGQNAGLSLGAAAGLSLDAGLRVGLDLSQGGDQDKQEDVVRPCQLEDYQCIRKLFAKNSQCSPSYGPAPDPLYLDQNTLYIPYANLTYTLTNLKITGMASAKISDLYINRVTGNVVISIQIKNLNETSPKAYLSYKRTGKEPIILSDVSSIFFSSLTLTAVLPRIPNLRLDLADIHAYIDDGAPEYKLGPGAYTSTDPDVASAFLQLSTNLNLVVREGFLLQAQLLAALFIQLNICDFGINLISV